MSLPRPGTECKKHDGGHADRQYRDHNVAPVQRVPEDLPGSSAALAVRTDHIRRGRFMTLSLPTPAPPVRRPISANRR
jgi:hypothetical protein